MRLRKRRKERKALDTKITVRDLFSNDVRISGDVYGNIADEIAVYFEGDIVLSEAGLAHFADVLDAEILSLSNGNILLNTAGLEKIEDDWSDYEFDNYDDMPPIIQLISDLFLGAAGYINDEEYNKYFISVTEDEDMEEVKAEDEKTFEEELEDIEVEEDIEEDSDLKEIQIYWNDLTEEKQNELIEAGLDDEEVIEGVYPVATILTEEEFPYETEEEVVEEEIKAEDEWDGDTVFVANKNIKVTRDNERLIWDAAVDLVSAIDNLDSEEARMLFDFIYNFNLAEAAEEINDSYIDLLSMKPTYEERIKDITSSRDVH